MARRRELVKVGWDLRGARKIVMMAFRTNASERVKEDGPK